MFRFVAGILSDFFDLLYPTLCLGCQTTLDKNETLLCVMCRINLPETEHHVVASSELLNKFAGRVRISHAAACYRFTKGSVIQKLIHQIKYKDRPEAAVKVGEWYGFKLANECLWLHEIDLLVGVPLHKKRLKQRGYNQADCIAAGISRMTGLPIDTNILVRTHFKGSQTHKNRLQRWLNVETVFRVRKTADVSGKHIAIVDDVLTTGATIESCAIELHRAGCRSVSVLTIAATR